MKDWNVVVTTREGGWQRARTFLRRFGEVARSDYFNVLLLRVDDVDGFLDRLAESAREEDFRGNGISHVFPTRIVFNYASREQFEAKARSVVLTLAAGLAGKTFHVRMHRRGFKGRISSQKEEHLLDGEILRSRAAAGSGARITFDDPDAVIDVETIGNRAGISLWTREDLARYPFLGVD